MALFKINKGLNANLPLPRHDGYAYFTTDDGKFWIDFEDNTDGVLQDDGTKVSRKALNAERADYVGYALTLQFDGDNQPTYNGLVARTYNISPENIHALSTVNGGTVAGPVTLNNVLTVNNDAYIDSATIGDLLVNGGTRFVGDVNAGTITASQFVGPLQGNATSADKVNHWLKIQVNGTDKIQYDGSGSNKTLNLTPEMLGVLGGTTLYALGDAVGGNAVAANKLNTNAGSTTRPVYFDAGIPKVISNSDEIDLIAKSANAVKENFIFQVKGTEQWRYNGSTSRTMNLTPSLIDAFDIVEGSTVSGEAIFNNVVYLNDETYADSLTAENEIVTGTLRVVGDLNGSVINATTFNGALNGNATSADKVNHWLKIQLNGTDAAQYDGSGSNKTVNITPAAIGALDTGVLYALGDAVGGNAVAANKLTVNAGASDTPIYFSNGVPTAVTGTQNINVASADKVNHWLKIQLNGTDAAQYDGSSSNKTVNVTAASVGALDSGTLYAGSATQGGSASSAVKLDNDKDAGSSILPIYFSSGVPVAVSTSDEINILAKQANKTTHWLKIQFNSTDQVTFDGSSSNKTLNITPSAIGALSTSTNYAGSTSVGGAANSANKLNTDAGDATHPVYFDNGVPVQVSGTQNINVDSADKVNHWLKIQTDSTDAVTYDGSSSNKTVNITPEIINAVRRNGDTIPGPLTINGVFTVNNDAYIDSATVGDLLVNGGTRFVGDVNAGKITSSQFVGPLQGNATSADKVNYWLKIQVNGTDKVQYDGSGQNKTLNLTPELLGVLGGTTKYALGDAVGGNAVAANKLNTNAGSTTRPVYFDAGIPKVISNTDEVDLVAKKANSLKENFIYQLRGTEQWRFNGSTARTLNIVPNDMGIFDTIEGSTVSGEAVFNNVVYLNDETYADSLTAENEIVTGTLRVVGDLNGSVINATTFNGNATSADKVNHWLKIQFNGTDQAQFDGSASNKTVNITPSAIGALSTSTNYAGSSSVGGAATSANKLNTNAGSSTLPVYFTGGVPSAVSTTDEINIIAKQANKTAYWLKIQADSTDQVTFDGSTQNKTLNITPELINAVRRNGDTIPGPLTINGVFTVNNDAYIDSVTIGDLLVNGGTRFVGDVNAGKITASSFVGPLTGNATSADKVNHWLKIQVNGTDKVTYDGSSENKTLNLTPSMLGLLGNDTVYALGDAVGGNAVAANSIRVPDTRSTVINPNSLKATNGVTFDFKASSVTGLTAGYSGVMSFRPYAQNSDWSGGPAHQLAFDANGMHWRKSTGDTTWDNWVDIITSDKHNSLTYKLRGSEQWKFNGDTARTLDIVPNDMGIFDTLLGSTVSGEAVFNNVVYLNDETYADSLTAENEIVTGTLRVVGDLNGSVINATTFNGNATSADKVNHWLKIQFNGTDKVQFDGSGENKTLNITPSAIGALASTTNYAGSSSVGGAATSANKLNTNAGSSTLPVYFTGGVPSAVSTTSTINIVAKQANKTTYWLKIQADGTDQVTFDGSTSNKTLNITPELINAVRRNGDTIPGPLTLNGVFTVNNDAYIDSATIGDLLVNGGTRFVGDVNASNITASSFSGPLTGNASTADKVNHWLKIQFNGTDKVQYDGSSENKTLNITPAAIGAVKIGGDTMTGSLTIGGSGNIGLRRTGRGVSWNKGRDGALVTQTSLSGYSPIWSVKTKNGSWDVGAYDAESYYDDLIFSYVPDSVYNGTNTTPTQIKFLENGHIVGTLDGNATSASKVNNKLKFQLRGTDQWEYDGSQAKTLNLSPNDMGIFDTLLGSTVSGEAVFNNVVYLNDETYADSLTAENEIVTGTLRVVGDLNGSVINATSLTGSLTGNATSADKVNHWLKIQADGTDQLTFDGSSENKTINISPELINAVRRNGDTIPGPLTLNGVMTINNDAYIDSATIGDLLVNGGTRFVGDVNAGNITASQFTGPLTGNATSADKVNHWLKIQFNGTDQAQFDGSGNNKTVNVTPNAIAAAPQVNGVYYGTCATAKDTKAKEVILVNGTGFQLVAGAMLVVKFTNASAAATMTLKVGTDAASAAAATGHTLYQYGTTKMADGTGTSGWPAGAIVLFIYDGTSWFRQFWYNNTYTLPTVTNIDCGTAAATAAKAITNGTWYTETAGNLFEVTMRYANTYAGPLTFNGKPLYINGTASSASNCTLPAGKYIVFYDGTNYYFRTDGLVPHVNGIYKQRYGNSNTKGVANGRLYFLLSDYVAPSTAYSSDMYNKTIYYKAFYKIRGISSNPSYNQNSMSGEFNTVIGVKINNSGASNLQQAVGYWSQVPTTFGSTSTIYISSDTNVVASRKHAQFYVTSSGTNDFEYEVELMSVEKLIIDDANSTVGTPEELHTTSYINGTYESCVFMNMTNTRTNCALLNSNYAGSISNSVYASLAFDASRLINYFTADNGTTNYYLTGRGSTTSGAYSYLYSNTKTYIKGSGLYSQGSLHMNDIYGTSGHTYGTTLPSSPTTGQLFFQIDGASGSGSSGGSLSLAQKNSGTMYVLGYDGSDNTKAYYNTNVYVDCSNGILRGAAWNDYAEYRRDNHMEKRLQKPGNCVKENGDGTLSLTTKRLERGCEIISDTFGMAIGQNAREGYDTPIAVSGRVLAYPYESIEEFKAHIGYPVCSGPNGTVSIMTDEEEEKYASRIIGTISEIPTYDKWGESQVDVDGRVWIRIK